MLNINALTLQIQKQKILSNAIQTRVDSNYHFWDREDAQFMQIPAFVIMDFLQLRAVITIDRMYRVLQSRHAVQTEKIRFIVKFIIRQLSKHMFRSSLEFFINGIKFSARCGHVHSFFYGLTY